MIRLRSVGLSLLFMMFLYPLVINAASVNYSFALLPLGIAVSRGRITRPSAPILAAVVLYVLIFCVASIYQQDFGLLAMRRITSFMLFISMFAFTLIEIDQEMISAFKSAIVAISLAFCLGSIYVLLTAGSGMGYELKDLVGSSRYGFVYLMAFWLVILREVNFGTISAVRYPVVAILVTGLLLTFSRSAIVSLLASAGFFILAAASQWVRRPRLVVLVKFAGAALVITAVVVLLTRLLPIAFVFLQDRLFSLLMDSDALQTRLTDSATSEGIRLGIWSAILEFVLRNPLTGSGYIGVWAVIGDRAGSAHNQYADVLFRTGFIGLLAYGGLLYSVVRYLRERQRALLWGFLAVLVYGMFHETFKESQGAFILAFLIGAVEQAGRSGRRLPPSPPRLSMDLPSLSENI